jgi:hypothetical protein
LHGRRHGLVPQSDVPRRYPDDHHLPHVSSLAMSCSGHSH